MDHKHALKALTDAISRYQGIKSNAETWLKRNGVPARLEGWSLVAFRATKEADVKNSIEKIESIRKSIEFLRMAQGNQPVADRRELDS